MNPYPSFYNLPTHPSFPPFLYFPPRYDTTPVTVTSSASAEAQSRNTTSARTNGKA
ncbi:hypothetical protein FRC11_006533 [Ceratobasidium sp. 423]|nr:hypothetical protein FRC11_006533 [Ceratobasidium sp. 423]